MQDINEILYKTNRTFVKINNIRLYTYSNYPGIIPYYSAFLFSSLVADFICREKK